MSVYFDHNASSPLKADVLKSMMPYLETLHANPSSLHQSGRLAKSAIETARQQIADALNCQPQQVIFTSGGTESNNTVLQACKNKDFLIGSVEHASVLAPVKLIAQHNNKSISYIKVNELGLYQLDDADLDETFAGLVSMQLVNNETGVIQPAGALKQHFKHALIHCDASQAMGKLSVDFSALDVDFLTLSAHKFNGPKGCGVIVIKNPQLFDALLSGGTQENNKRAGSENVAAIVGTGKAAQIVQQQLTQRINHCADLRDYFEQQLALIEGVTIFAQAVTRVCNTSFFALPFFHGETLLMECDRAGFELASGSACHSLVTQPSHVLQAMHIDESIALNAIRVSFGESNTRLQIDEFMQFIQSKLENLPAVIKSAVGSN